MRRKMHMRLSVKVNLCNAGRTLALQWSSFTQPPQNLAPLFVRYVSCVVCRTNLLQAIVSYFMRVYAHYIPRSLHTFLMGHTAIFGVVEIQI